MAPPERHRQHERAPCAQKGIRQFDLRPVRDLRRQQRAQAQFHSAHRVPLHRPKTEGCSGHGTTSEPASPAGRCSRRMNAKASVAPNATEDLYQAATEAEDPIMRSVWARIADHDKARERPATDEQLAKIWQL